MKNFSIYIIFFALISCNRAPVFDFDSVTFYHIKNDADCNRDEIFCDLLYEDSLAYKSMNLVESQINKFYARKMIDEKTTNELRDIYTNEMYLQLSETKCEPIYRDILVFKKKDIITGISKVCFECNMSYSIDLNGQLMEINEKKIEELHSLLE
jgi:hypothetical protein